MFEGSAGPRSLSERHERVGSVSESNYLVDRTSSMGGTRPLRADPVARQVRQAKPRSRRAGVVIGYLLAVVLGGLTAFILEAGQVAWWTCAGAAGILLVEFLTIPAYARSRSMRPANHLVSFGAAFLVLGTVAGELSPPEVRASFFVLSAVTAAVAASVGVQRVLRRKRTTLLVGDRVGVGHLIAQWAPRPEVDIRGVCLASTDDDRLDHLTEVRGVPVLGDLMCAPQTAINLGVDEVVVAPGPVLTAYDVRRLSWALESSNVELTVAAEVHGAVPRRIEPRLLGRRLLLSVRPGRRPKLAMWVKGLIDRTGAVVLLLLTAPLLAACAVAVRLDSRGPVIFSQTRSGLDGRLFTMLKFRTMSIDAEEHLEELRPHNEGAGPLFKLRDDPRVTRVGGILRKTSLDELPQLVNVIKGEMSLIGPRPGLPSEADSYDAWIRHRLTVKPGMTGAWQVNGRSSLMWDESVRLDLDYVDNQTLTGDLVIAAKTVRAVFRPDGS